jgi:hypothetical protein
VAEEWWLAETKGVKLAHRTCRSGLIAHKAVERSRECRDDLDVGVHVEYLQVLRLLGAAGSQDRDIAETPTRAWNP